VSERLHGQELCAPFVIQLPHRYSKPPLSAGRRHGEILPDTFRSRNEKIALRIQLFQGATAATSAAIAVEAGVLLGACFLLVRNLWLPIGLHIGWNFTEGGVFGAPISGHAAQGLVRVRLQGPDAITGGGFGPEASPAAMGVCVIVAAFILYGAWRRGEWRPVTLRLYAH
jgi:hypothetical protein